MVTAERLFAMNGVEGVTLTEIQAAAGQSNSSVITYHFGSQAGLVRALLEFRYQKINARRAELLRETVPDLLSGMPERARLGREVQLYNSVLSLLAEFARGHQRISEAQLSNYVDGWVGMLTAPLSPATSELMRRE
jgi:AcrR family transcriptional regulator